MRTSLIVLGVVFLVIGVILFIYPSQSFSVQTNVAPTGQSNPVSSSANFEVPVEWTYALSAIGLIFLFFGSLISSPEPKPVPVVPVPVPAPTPPPIQTHTVITTPGPRGPRGSKGSKGLKGSKGKKGKVQSAKTVEVSVVRNNNPTKRGLYPTKSSVTTTTTRTAR